MAKHTASTIDLAMRPARIVATLNMGAVVERDYFYGTLAMAIGHTLRHAPEFAPFDADDDARRVVELNIRFINR